MGDPCFEKNGFILSCVNYRKVTLHSQSPEMVVVLKAVRGFPKNCWDSNISLDIIKRKVRQKNFSPFPALRICLFDILFIQTYHSFYSTVEDYLPKYCSSSFPHIISISATFYKMSEEQVNFSNML